MRTNSKKEEAGLALGTSIYKGENKRGFHSINRGFHSMKALDFHLPYLSVKHGFGKAKHAPHIVESTLAKEVRMNRPS